MADKTARKTILIQLNAEADRAGREVAKLTAKLRDSKFAQQEAAAAGDQNKLSLVSQRRALAAAKDARREAATATKRHAAAVGRSSKAIASSRAGVDRHSAALKKQTGGFSASTIAAGLWAAAIAMATRAATGGISTLIQKGLEWEGTVGSLGKEVTRLGSVTANLISPQALSRLAEYREAMGWSQDQTDTLARSTVAYARIAKVDFSQAMRELTDAVRGAESEGLKKLGLSLRLTGTLEEKQTKILGALSARYGDMRVVVGNASEATDAYNSRTETLYATIGKELVQSKDYRLWLQYKEQALTRIKDIVLTHIKGIRRMTVVELEGYRSSVVWVSGKIKWLRKLSEEWNKYTGILDPLGFIAKRGLRHGEAKIDAVLANVDAALVKAKAAATEAAHVASMADHLYSTPTWRGWDGSAGRAAAAAKKTALARRKVVKDDYRAHEMAYDQHLRKRAKAARVYDRKQQRARQAGKKAEMAAEARFERDLRKAREKTARATIAAAVAQKAGWRDMAGAFLDTTVAALAAADSASQAMENLVTAGLSALSRWALGQAAAQFAEGMAKLGTTWGVPNPGATAHFAAAAGFAVVGGGLGIAAANIGSSSSGSGGGAAAAAGTGSSSSGSSSGTGSSPGAGQTIVNKTEVHVRGRKAGLYTRRQMRNDMRRLAAGRS